MKNKINFLIGILILIVFISGVFALTGNSSSYTADSKTDTGATANSTSTSFLNRFISGFQAVGQYISSAFTGRWGVLGSTLRARINITYPLNLQEFSRGGTTATEDDLGIVPNNLNLTAKVYDSSTIIGIQNANCSFYDSSTLLGTSLTNSSGDCVYSFDKTASDSIIKYLVVNFSSSDVDTDVLTSYLNISIAKHTVGRTMTNLRTNGKYYDGDTVVLEITIRKTNATDSNILYDPQNISADAATSTNALRGHFYYPGGNITKVSTGLYNVTVLANYTFGALVKWNVTISDDNFVNYLASTVHGDEDICAGDFGAWSAWSACASSTQTRTRTDSSGCTEVGSQSCTIVIPPGGGGGETCSNDCTSGATEESCSDSNTIRSRICGNYDADSCSEWGSWSYSSCASGKICENAACVTAPILCTNDCTSGATEEICSSLSTIISRSCGNYDADTCLEWSIFSSENCESGKFCSSGECNNCLEIWECGDWGECDSSTQKRTRTCTETNNCAVVKEREEEIDCDKCLENWECEWSVCEEGDSHSSPFSCVDESNNGEGCGTRDYYPAERKCAEEACAKWKCSGWGECNAEYNIDDVLAGANSATGFQERNCTDLNDCKSDRNEKKQCSLVIPIEAKTVKWCYEDYVEIFDADTNELVSRVKEREVSEISNIKRVDLSFMTSSEFSGYCNFCYDKVKNYDESEADCGGENCPTCIQLIKFFDWLRYLIIFLWMFVFLLIVLSARTYKEEAGMFAFDFKSRVSRTFEVISPKRKVERERELEEKIEGWFKKITPSIKISFKKKPEEIYVKPKEVYEKPAEEKMKRFAFFKRIKVPVISPKEKLLEDMKIKLRVMKREGYAGTVELENKIRRAEESIGKKEKSFVTKIIKGYRMRKVERENQREIQLHKDEREDKMRELENKKEEREERFRESEKERNARAKEIESEKMKKNDEHVRKLEEIKRNHERYLATEKRKEFIKKFKAGFGKLFERSHEKKIQVEDQHAEKIRKQLVKEHKKREKVRAKEIKHFEKKRIKEIRKVEKVKNKEEKKRVKEIKHAEKKRIKVERKIKKKKIRSLKREVRKRKLLDLMRKLRLWKKEGYYGTAALEEEIKRLKSGG